MPKTRAAKRLRPDDSSGDEDQDKLSKRARLVVKEEVKEEDISEIQGM